MNIKIEDTVRKLEDIKIGDLVTLDGRLFLVARFSRITDDLKMGLSPFNSISEQWYISGSEDELGMKLCNDSGLYDIKRYSQEDYELVLKRKV